MSLPIIEVVENREHFIEILKVNPGVFIVKFGADWCAPCKAIESLVNESFSKMPTNVQCAKIDVDESFDIYALLKSKKIVAGIPSMLCYKKGNNTYIPDDVVIGASKEKIDDFFNRCLHYAIEIGHLR
jgi:thioredoxin 1